MSDKFVTDTLREARGEIESLRQQLSARDAEIKTIRNSPTMDAIRRVIETKLADENNELRHQLANEFDKREALDNELADHLKREVMLRDAMQIFADLHFKEAIEALTATNDLDGLILCDKEPCRDDGRCQYAIDHGAEELGHCQEGKCCMPLYRAWEPK
jgi:RecG-like helicase